MNAEKTTTRFGNARSPGYAQVIDWMSEIWADMDSNIRADSFAITGCIGHRTVDLHPPLRRLLTDPEPLHDYVEQEDKETGEELFADVTLSQYDDDEEDRHDYAEEEVAEGTDVEEESDREQ